MSRIRFFVLLGGLLLGLTIMSFIYFQKNKRHIVPPNQDLSTAMMSYAKDSINIILSQKFEYEVDYMQVGVLQHLDRVYTYDIVPEKLEGGILFQGIHRPENDLTIELGFLAPTEIYFFFHDEVDGGYSEIFKRLGNWKRIKPAPQYDIYNGKHGWYMKMYHLSAKPGSYCIPPTTKSRGCFSMVFQPLNQK